MSEGPGARSDKFRTFHGAQYKVVIADECDPAALKAL